MGVPYIHGGRLTGLEQFVGGKHVAKPDSGHERSGDGEDVRTRCQWCKKS